MKYLVGLLMLTHALLHFLGFVKAFQLAEISQLSHSISKPLGMLWALAALLFIAAFILFIQNHNWWFAPAILAVILSQILIIIYWKDARFGTIANGLILMLAIIHLAAWRFENHYNNDVLTAIKATPFNASIITQKDLDSLPPVVQKYLNYVGVIGKPKIKNMKILFEGEMREKGKDWFKFTSEQHNFFDTPTRLFFMKAKVKGLPTTGYHAYGKEGASMLIKLVSLLPVVDLNMPEMYPTETVTYFNDLCLFAPAALIDKRIKWELLDDLSVKATFTNNETSISAILYFNKSGQLIDFISNNRYSVSEMKKFPFSTPTKNYKNIKGYNLPTYGEAVWYYPDGEFVYGKFHLKSIEYNISDLKE